MTLRTNIILDVTPLLQTVRTGSMTMRRLESQVRYHRLCLPGNLRILLISQILHSVLLGLRSARVIWLRILEKVEAGDKDGPLVPM